MSEANEKEATTEASDAPEAKSSWLDRLALLGFVVGLMVVSLLYGMAAYHFQWPPYRLVRDAKDAGDALYQQVVVQSNPWPDVVWAPAHPKRRGVKVHEPSLAFDGATLYSTAGGLKAVLVDPRGQVLHEWALPYRDVWEKTRHIANPVVDRQTHWRRSHVYPDGGLVAICETHFSQPRGYGLVRLDRGSRILWTLGENTHHDMVVDEDGTIYTLWQEETSAPLPYAPWLRTPLMDEGVLIVSADGKLLEKYSVLEAFADSDYWGVLESLPKDEWDIMHLNTIHPISEAFAAHYPEISSGDVMVCLRNPNLICVISKKTKKVVWLQAGPWAHPHDPDPLPNGNFVLFDNRWKDWKASRVIEFDPRTNSVPWQFTGAGRWPTLFERVMSCQDPLPNGNVLITYTRNGLLLEATREGKIAWAFFNLDRGGEKDELIANIFGARRYAWADVPFVPKPAASETRP